VIMVRCTDERGSVSRTRALVVSLLLLLIAGCATTQPAEEKSNEQVVSQRAKVRWQHLLKGEFSLAYGYASPAYRSGNSERQYRSGLKAGLWRGAEVRSVQCGEVDVCKVDMEIEFQFVARMSGPVSAKQVLTETWRKDAGEWWYVPDMR
jgi:hypothetical protein